METVDFSAVENGLKQAGSDMGAAEAHGLLCGLLSVQSALSHKEWLQMLLKAWDEQDVLAQELIRSLSLLHVQTLQDLNDPELKFNLFLPDEQVDIHQRVEAVVDWCSGYLYGLGLHLQQATLDSNEQLQEVIDDFNKIVQIDLQEGDEASEEDLFEISEYVRMAVLMVYDTLQPVQKREISIQ